MITTPQAQLPYLSQGRFRALVVDHDLDSRRALCGLLESEGCDVIEVQEATAATIACHNIQPDIVLVNAILPETLSFDLCAQIQSLPNDPTTPVLVIVENDEEVVDRALTAGAADYVTKPIRPRILRQRIRRLLRAHQTAMSVIRAKKEWEAAFDAVSDMVILTDLDGKIIRCNLATIQRLETSYSQLIGFNIEDVLLKDIDPKVNLTFGQPSETHLPALPGWFEVRLFPGQVGSGHRTIVYVLKDITERKRAEEAVRASEARYRTLFEDSPVALWEEDFSGVKTFFDRLRKEEGITDFRAYFEAHPQALIECAAGVTVRDVNKAAMKLLNAQRKQQLLGELNHIVSPETNLSFLEQMIAIANGCLHYSFEGPNRALNGEIRLISGFWSVWPGYENTLSKVTVSIVDLTERKQAETALAESEQRFRQLFAASPDAVIVIDPRPSIDWRIVDCNEAACRMNGYAREEMIGQSIDLLHGTPGTIQERTTYLERLRREGVVHLETFHQHKDGHVFPVEISTTLFTLEGRELILGIDRDITERKQAEEALGLSEERFQLVAHATNDAVWDLNLPTGERWWNRGLRSLFGYRSNKITANQDWWESQIHPDDRAKVLASFQSALTSDGEFWSKEYRFCRADGSYAYVFDRGYIIQDGQGMPVRVIGAMMDISDRKQFEDALHRREQQLEEAQQIAHLGSWEWDSHTNLSTWSDELYRLYGWEPRAITPSHEAFMALIHPDDQESALEIVGKAFQTNRPYDFDYRIISAKGETRWLHGHGEFLKNELGQVVRSRGTAQDITERKQMEEALRKSEETFSKAFHTSPAPMAIARIEDGLIIDVNNSWERLLGYDRQDVIGHQILDLNIYTNPHDRSMIMQQVQEQGKIIDYELKAKTKAESELDLLMSAQIAEIQGQNCLLSAFYDITELRRMHGAMLASQKLADLGTLAAGVAHEMNSPLQVITGVSQSLLKKADNGGIEPEQLKRNLDVIHRNGWRCAEIVRSLHTYAHNSGRTMEPTSLNELVSDGLLLIEHQLKSWANISVQTALAADLPSLTCDRNQITQVLINLLTNARDAMPDGGEITIATSYDPKSDQLVLQVSDTGVGIPASIQAKIFDPFFTTKPLGKGTGLGLSIVAGIIRAHGGTISLNEALSQGTTVTVRFPTKPIKLPNPDSDNVSGRYDDVPQMLLPITNKTH